MEPEVGTQGTASFMGLGELITTVAQVINDYGLIGIAAVAIVIWVIMGRPPLKQMLGNLIPAPGLTADDVTTLLESHQAQVQEGLGAGVDAGPAVSYQEFNNQIQRIEKENRAAHKDMFAEVRKLGDKIDRHFENHTQQIAQFREESRIMLHDHAAEDEAQFGKLNESFTKQDKTLAVWEDRWTRVGNQRREA